MKKAKNISTELRRTYVWPNGSTVVVEGPKRLIVSDSGHRVSDSKNNGHFIPYGWIHLFWENKPGAPAIVC